MDIIDNFVRQYRREYDFFEKSARLVHDRLESTLASSGIRAIVTYRAKRPEGLEQKLRKRNISENYQNSDDIYRDIVDLSGVRVALYFPNSVNIVDKIIRENFVLNSDPIVFPKPKSSSSQVYEKVFSGYGATHYRVKPRVELLNAGAERYAEATVEIQVASVLMHAWSEVEHDLIYKPLQGSLSDDELIILDEINGLVLTGELSLNRLQTAIERRLSSEDAKFNSRFDLAAFLHKLASPKLSEVTESSLGRVDILYEALVKKHKNQAKYVQDCMEKIDADTEKRPIAEQIIDMLIANDPSGPRLIAIIQNELAGLKSNVLENIYPGVHPESNENIDPSDELIITADNSSSIGARSMAALSYQTERNTLIGEFHSKWIVLERMLRDLAMVDGISTPKLPNKTEFYLTPKVIGKLDINPDTKAKILMLRTLRNNLIHSHYSLSTGELEDSIKLLELIRKRLRIIVSKKILVPPENNK